MSILFCGGELDDFALTGTITANTTAANFRSAYARMAVNVTGSATFQAHYARASFTASSAFSVTGRVISPLFAVNNVFFWLATGGSARLRLKMSSSTSPSTIVLESYTSGGAASTLATSTLTIALNVLYKLDVVVDYQVSGRVRVY